MDIEQPDGSVLPPEDASAPDPLVGALVAGRFLVEAPIAVGGSGRIYRAHQVGLDRDVALKVLHPHLALDPTQHARFHREALAASRLRHPSAVVVHDFGEWEGRLFLAMELILGRSLGQLVDEEHPLPTSRFEALLGPVCEVLEEVHAAGILHRDVKPENILVATRPDGSPCVKLVDFGLVMGLAALPSSGPRLTPLGVVSGTPEYMSPEQCRGAGYGPTSDLYSLGAVLYELIAGEPPFVGSTPMDVFLQHLYATPKPPSSTRPPGEVPPALDALVLRALAKSPDERPPSARAFRTALAAAVRGTSTPMAPAADPSGRPHPAREERAAAAGVRMTPGPTRRALPGILTGLAVTVVEGAGNASRALGPMLVYHGAVVHSVPTAAAALVEGADATALVVDGRGDAEAALAALADVLPLPLPVVFVGPVESLAPMARALELGVVDYVPAGTLPDRLLRALERLQRRARRAPA